MDEVIVELKEYGKNFDSLLKTLKYTQDNYILVGIPQKSSSREKLKASTKSNKVTNAELMYIHTNGSPANNIPARPVIEPAIEDNKEQIAKYLHKAFEAMCEGNEDVADRELHKAGTKAYKACRAWFVNPKNGWKPNSPAVIAAKLKKGSTDPKPLIDTGDLRKSITYVLVKKGVRQ